MRSIALLGIHPTFMHSPPSLFFSMEQTFNPISAPIAEIAIPAGPIPIVMIS